MKNAILVFAVAFAGCVTIGNIPAMGQEPEAARFHHIHLNVTNVDASIQYYRKYFSGVLVKYHGAEYSILTDRSFLLFKKVDAPPPSELKSAIWHIGWGGVDGPSEYQWRLDAGAKFQTPLTALGNNHYMYAEGPDGELIEVWTGYKHNRFGHVHLLAEDVNTATHWYMDNLGLRAGRRDVPKPTSDDPNAAGGRSSNQVTAENVTINIFSKPTRPARWLPESALGPIEPTRGRVVDHLAFSYRKIEPVLERMKKAGVEIVEPISVKSDYKIKSFFVMGTDKVLVEIVEEKPIPEGIWE